ncbi:MAG: hypothetical protein HY048_18190 [Acidobacteria bacterium]|nr:hypothetical protein [Acidobacteriota bacterium]
MDIKHSQPETGKPLEIFVRIENKWATLLVTLPNKALHPAAPAKSERRG